MSFLDATVEVDLHTTFEPPMEVAHFHPNETLVAYRLFVVDLLQSVVHLVVEAVEPPSYHVDLVVGLPAVEEHVDAAISEQCSLLDQLVVLNKRDFCVVPYDMSCTPGLCPSFESLELFE